MRTFSVFCKRSYLCDVLITSSDALGRKMLDLSHSLSIVMSYKYFEFFPALCVTLIMMVSADCSQNNSDPSWAGQRLHAFQRFLDCTAQHTTILRLTQELQLIMFNQVFIFRHAAGFTYGITEQWKMSFVEIFSLSSRISLSQDVKWDYTKYSINQRD